MTGEEVIKLLMIMTATYPNFKVDNKTETAKAWLILLEEYDSKQIFEAFKNYVKSNGSGFAPSVAQLIHETQKVNELATMSEAEAWSIVRNAIGKSAYNSQREFDKLPSDIQRAVGSAEQLHLWAVDENYNDGVVMSLFQRNYKTTIQRTLDENRLSSESRLRLENLRQQNTVEDNHTLYIGTFNVEESKPVACEILERIKEQNKW